MKKLIALAFTILSVMIVHAQNFEGLVTYVSTYTSKKPDLKDETLTAIMGRMQTYYIKGGNYRSNTNGTFAKWQLYINKENRIYNKMSSSDTLFWNDASINKNTVLKVTLNKNATEILGYKCDELILNCKGGLQKYYFNSSLGVDTKLFEKHKYGNWYEYLKAANAVPLKMVFEDKQFTMVSAAAEVKPMKLEDSLFRLPPNSKTAKSPY